jgi:hypothetical protein
MVAILFDYHLDLNVGRIIGRSMSNKRQTRANRKNAEPSTGPCAAVGTARVAPNVPVHGPTGKRIILSSEEDVGDKPLRRTSASAEIGSHATLPEDNSAQVSFFITKAQKLQLRELGYSKDQIAQMKPAEAHLILGLT